MRISDWSSDVCSSDLGALQVLARIVGVAAEPVSVGVDHALGRVEQALASRIVASPAQQGTHRVLGLPAADAVALFVSVGQIGRAHVCTPVPNAHPVCRLLLAKKNYKDRISQTSTPSLAQP